jgi:hypothetical protein
MHVALMGEMGMENLGKPEGKILHSLSNHRFETIIKINL